MNRAIITTYKVLFVSVVVAVQILAADAQPLQDQPPRIIAGRYEIGVPFDAKFVQQVIAKNMESVTVHPVYLDGSWSLVNGATGANSRSSIVVGAHRNGQIQIGKKIVTITFADVITSTPEDQLLLKELCVSLPSAAIAELIAAQPGIIDRLDEALQQARPTAVPIDRNDRTALAHVGNTNPRALLPRGLSGWQLIDATETWIRPGTGEAVKQRETVVGRYIPELGIVLRATYQWNEGLADKARQLDGMPTVSPEDVHTVTDLSPTEAVVQCPAILIPDMDRCYRYGVSAPRPGLPTGTWRIQSEIAGSATSGVMCRQLGGVICPSRSNGIIIVAPDTWIDHVVTPEETAAFMDGMRRINEANLAKRPTATELPQLLQQQDREVSALTDIIAKLTAAHTAQEAYQAQFTKLNSEATNLDQAIKQATAANTGLEADGGSIEVRHLDGTVERVQLNRKNYQVRKQLEDQTADLRARCGVLVNIRAKYRDAFRDSAKLIPAMEAAIKHLQALQARIKMVDPEHVLPIPKPDKAQTGYIDKEQDFQDRQQAISRRLQERADEQFEEHMKAMRDPASANEK